MGPRAIARGNESRFLPFYSCHFASMGPRAIARGNGDHSNRRIFNELRCGLRAIPQGSPGC